ncbi:MAG TPA: hypothetical protein VJV79_02965 [Polyangiaceae bacterium]|nr:hypothetical protein [Polyangiaceae bacterium]
MPRGFRHPSILSFVNAGPAFLISLLLAASGAADDVQHQSIPLTLAAPPSSAGKVEAMIRDSFARHSWALDLRTVPTIDPHAIVTPNTGQSQSSVWLNLVGPSKALYLVEQSHGLVYTRELDVHESPDAVELELITFVVESSIEAMQAGAIQGVPRAEFERRLDAREAVRPPSSNPPTKPATPPAAQSQPSVTLGPRVAQLTFAGGYYAELIGDSAVAHGPFVGGHWQLLGIGLDGSLRTQWPVHVTTADIDMKLWSSNLRLHATLPVRIDERMLLRLGLGGGWEITQVSPASAAGVAPFWASAPLLSGFAAGERSWGRFFVSMRFDLDFDLIEVRYRTTRAGLTSTEWRPYRLRPSAAALVGFRY